jgi:hypothetical protein
VTPVLNNKIVKHKPAPLKFQPFTKWRKQVDDPFCTSTQCAGSKMYRKDLDDAVATTFALALRAPSFWTPSFRTSVVRLSKNIVVFTGGKHGMMEKIVLKFENNGPFCPLRKEPTTPGPAFRAARAA